MFTEGQVLQKCEREKRERGEEGRRGGEKQMNSIQELLVQLGLQVEADGHGGSLGGRGRGRATS